MKNDTKKTASAIVNDEYVDIPDDGLRPLRSAGWLGGKWVPTLNGTFSDLKQEKLDELYEAVVAKMAGAERGLVSRTLTMVGVLDVVEMWGHNHHVLIRTKKDGSTVQFMMPSNGSLMWKLNRVPLGSKVKVEYQGQDHTQLTKWGKHPNRYEVSTDATVTLSKDGERETHIVEKHEWTDKKEPNKED